MAVDDDNQFANNRQKEKKQYAKAESLHVFTGHSYPIHFVDNKTTETF